MNTQDYDIYNELKDGSGNLIFSSSLNPLRSKLQISEVFHFSPQAAYRFLLSKENLPPIFSQNNINLFFGRGRHFVTYPTGNEDMINFVFCKREKGLITNDWKEKVTKQQFLKDFQLDENILDLSLIHI